MKNTAWANFLGIIIVLAVGYGLYYWLGQISPDPQVVKEQAASVKTVDKNILNNSSVKKISERQKFGNIPVTIPEGDLGKSNPFE